MGFIGVDSPAVRLRDTLILTAAYVASRELSTREAETVKVMLQIDFVNATSVEIRVQTQEDVEGAAGTVAAGSWTTKGVVIAPTAAGISPLLFHTVQLTATDFGAGTHDVSFEVLISADSKIRVQAKLTGTADATLRTEAVRGQGT